MSHRTSYRAMAGSLPFALPARVRVHEVGPRDGFQLEKLTIPTPDKVGIVDALSRTGVTSVQATSFVRPDAVPQLADAEQVLERIHREPEVQYGVLVPNLRGAQRALACQADRWDLMLSVTDSHSIANANRPTGESLSALAEVTALAAEHDVQLLGGLGTALGCPFEGRVPYDRVAWVVSEYRNLGVRRVAVCDTVGVADPAVVYDVCSRLSRDFPDLGLVLHLHNTRGMGLANVMAGLAAGVTDFDASVGGLGGCPFAPGASGNVATEDLVHMLDLLGIETGVDAEALTRIARDQVAPLIDHPLESSLARSGPAWEVHAPPQRQETRPASLPGLRPNS